MAESPAARIAELEAMVQERDEMLEAKEEELTEMEGSLQTALVSIRNFHGQQKQLFDEFVTLRTKYDQTQERLANVLFQFLPEHTERFWAVPQLDEDLPCGENSVDRFRLGKVLGEGQFAIVREAEVDVDGARDAAFAVKIVRKVKVNTGLAMSRLQNEIAALTKFKTRRHPGIPTLYACFHNVPHVFIVTNRGGRDLFMVMDEMGTDQVEPERAKNIISQLLMAVGFIHNHGIAHRDVKPENILLDESGNLMLVDFGMCIESDQSTLLFDFCGSPGFFAPEMLLGKSGYDAKLADIWSIACVLLEMSLGPKLFGEVWMPSYEIDVLSDPEKFEDQLAQSLDNYVGALESIGADPGCIEQVQRMLKLDVNERPDTAGCCGNEYIRDSIPPSSPGSPSSPVTPEGKRAEPSEFNQKSGGVGVLRPLGHRVGGNGGALRPQGNSLSIITKKNYLKDPVARTGLPPLGKEPLTPTVKGAQVNRDEGDRLLRATGQSPRVGSPPPRSASPPVQKPSRFNPARCSTPP